MLRPAGGSALLLLAAAAFACSPGGDANTTAAGGTESTGTESGSGGGNGGGNGGPAGPGSGGETGAITVSVGTGQNGSGGACAANSISAELVPVTLLIVFDKSGSMEDGDKWGQATAALTSFVQSPDAAGLGVGIKFFPKGDCDENDCDVGICSLPDVPPARLSAEPAPNDAQEQALVTAIAAENPNGGTPMAAALLGAHNWAQSFLALNPADKVAIVLVTDGIPEGCGDIGDVANSAALGFAQGVPTYAVGLQGSLEANMNTVAQAGGTETGFFIGAGNAQADLLAALLAIQGQQIACELTIPEADDVDPTKVNVTFTPDGGEEGTIPQVENAAACGPSGGWYYDDPVNPTKITLCDATCDQIQGQSGELGLALGCETIVAN